MSEPRDGAFVPPEPASGLPWLPAGADVEQPPRITAGRVVGAALSLVLVGALLLWVLPWITGADWSGIAGSIASLPAWALPTVVALGLASIALEAVTVTIAVKGARYPVALQGHAASGALALAMPGGGMLGMYLLGWILRRTGLALPVIFTGIIAASLVEMLITSILIPLVGLGSYALSSLLAPTGLALPGAIWAAVAAVAGAVIALGLTALLLKRSVLAGLLEQLGQMMPFEHADAVLEQRDALIGLLRRRPAGLMLPTVAARILQWVALLVAIEAVGAEVPLLLTIAIFALGRVLSLVPLTPGGAGITETVSAAALVALGVGAEASATAMLLLAVTTLVVPLLGGAVAAATTFARRPRRD